MLLYVPGTAALEKLYVELTTLHAILHQFLRRCKTAESEQLQDCCTNSEGMHTIVSMPLPVARA